MTEPHRPRVKYVIGPDGNYTIAVNATDASGQPATISSQIEGTVDSVDLTKTPPTLSIGGNSYTISQIKQVIRAGATQSTSSSSSSATN